MLTASLRADGSSVFAPGKKWGYFPSVALAWRINEENFLKNVDAISNLKLRLSWGQSANVLLILIKPLVCWVTPLIRSIMRELMDSILKRCQTRN